MNYGRLRPQLERVVERLDDPRRPSLLTSVVSPDAVTRRIRILDDTLVDQIAAGEVVERPASAVKELLENAVDAGASRIELEIEDGGKTCIRVSDDGTGMSAEDAALAVKRHATSKIRSFDDLVRVRSLGFRGEALPSIASVSRFSLRTRPHDATSGTEVRIEGGGEPQLRPAGGAAGTTIEVRDLFYNVPARRKFMKATHAEAARIHDVLIRTALAHPSLRFTFRSNGRELRALSPALGLPGRAMAIFRGEALDEIAHAEGSLRVEAMLGSGSSSKQSSRQLYVFVNGRPVIDPALVRAVTHAYGAELPPGRFPVGVVHVELPPEEVDVNVHPQKIEVRLARAQERQRQILEIIARARVTRGGGGGPVSRPVSYWDERLSGARVVDRTPTAVSDAPSPVRDPWGVGAALRGELEQPAAPARTTREAQEPRATPRARTLRYVGRVRDRHLVCESQEGLWVIDARRAGALLLEDRLTRALREGSLPSRRLVFPPRVKLANAPAVVERAGSMLARLGFDVAALSPETIAVHSIPEALGAVPAEQALAAGLRATERDDAAAVAALVEVAGAAVVVTDDDASALVAFVEGLEDLPRGLCRTVDLDTSEDPE
jgi:DNA mismatch repair protein MutL